MPAAESIARIPASHEVTYIQRAAWRMIPGKGRGVVAAEDIAAGEEIERSPVVVVPASDLLERDEPLTVPDQYLLYWSDDEGAELAMGGGLLMFYNHSEEPNVEFDDGPFPETMSVYAIRDIKAGEELVYDYGCDLWFDPA
jgi:SET domain-containing protein